MEVIIYTRVSTEEQKESGFSLQDQERRLRNHCAHSGFHIVAHYQDNASAKSFNRPQFQRMLDDLRNGRVKAEALYVVRMDRFSRNLHNSLDMLQALSSLGVQVIPIENPVELDSPESMLPYIMNLLLPQIENERRGLNTQRGTRQARLEGRWTSRAPKGYYNDKANKTVEVSDDARFVQMAFREVARDLKSKNDIRKDLFRLGFKCSKQQFYNLLRNPFYIGKVPVKALKGEPEQLVEGNHEAIITEELFQAVQDVLDRGKRKQAKPSAFNPKFPLRGHLICKECGSNLTASTSRGRSSTYDYYHCQRGCNERFNAIDANEKFVSILSHYQINEDLAKLYYEILKRVFDEHEKDKRMSINTLTSRLNTAKDKLTVLDEKLLDGAINDKDYNRIGERVKREIDKLEHEIRKQQLKEPFHESHIRNGLSILSNLKGVYQNAPIDLKHKVIGSIFPEKLEFNGTSYRTEKTNLFVSLITSKRDGLSSPKMKQAAKSGDLSNWAPPPGLEPGTL